MEPIKDITQTEISETIDNPIDKAGNKIKLRSVSHENIIRHLKNIPYKTKKGPQIKSSKINLPKEAVEWNLTPKQYVESIETGRKPINVKENMIENIKKHSEIAVEETKEEPEVKVTPKIKEEKEIVVKDEFNKKMEKDQVVEVSADVDVEKKYKEIDSIREKVISKKELMEKAKQEADDSDKQVQDLGVQYTEVQKQLQEAKIRNKEMKSKLLAALKNQKETLTIATQQYDRMIEEANKRKEANKNLTAEMQPKIDNTQNETANINNDTARIEEYLNAIISDKFIDFESKNNSLEEEKNFRRVS